MTVGKLFEPISLKSSVKIKNRLFKGAMSEGMLGHLSFNLLLPMAQLPYHQKEVH